METKDAVQKMIEGYRADARALVAHGMMTPAEAGQWLRDMTAQATKGTK